MYVEILTAVNVPDVLPLPALKVDRVRSTSLVARRDAANEGALGAGKGGC
jgi:hypothetical protein